MFSELAKGRLMWLPELGVGYYPVENSIAPYDGAYFERVRKNAETKIGVELMEARANFVAKHYTGFLVDVGIGSGAFIERRTAHGFQTGGYDVNPVAVEWLRMRGKLCDPYNDKCKCKWTAMSFWDVLEHIEDFRPLLANIEEWLFVSVPIFKDCDHVLRSKHYRKDEHFHYWTRDGLVGVMSGLGFKLVEESDFETRIGREDIMSFAFRR